jgi:hypothetical protein
MKKTLLLLAALSWLVSSAPVWAAGADCGTFDPAWQSCSSDQDCVKGYDACHAPAAYNKDSLDAATKYASCKAPMIRCAQNMSPDGPAVCKAGVCTIAPPSPAPASKP